MASDLSIRMRKELRHAEICQASWYLYVKRGPILESSIRAQHFLAEPMIGVVWEKCQALARAGKTWELYELLGHESNSRLYADITADTTWGQPVINERLMLQCSEAHQYLMRHSEATGRYASGEIAVEEYITTMRDGAGKIERHAPKRGLSAKRAASGVVDMARGEDADMFVPFMFFPKPWQNMPRANVHLVTAETSSHKTTTGICAALSVAQSHDPSTGEIFPVSFWTLEDSTKFITSRMTTHLADADLQVNEIMSGRLKEGGLRGVFQGAKRLHELPIEFFEGAVPIEELIAVLYRDWSHRGTAMSVIDYLGDIEIDESKSAPPEYVQMGRNVRRLVQFAQKTNQLILLLAQLKHEYSNTKGEQEGTTRAPTLGDIYGGSRVHQKVHSVLMNHVIERGVAGTADQRMKCYIRKFKSYGRDVIRLRVDPVHNRIWQEDFKDQVGEKVTTINTRFARNRGYTPLIPESN